MRGEAGDCNVHFLSLTPPGACLDLGATLDHAGPAQRPVATLKEPCPRETFCPATSPRAHLQWLSPPGHAAAPWPGARVSTGGCSGAGRAVWHLSCLEIQTQGKLPAPPAPGRRSLEKCKKKERKGPAERTLLHCQSWTLASRSLEDFFQLRADGSPGSGAD